MKKFFTFLSLSLGTLSYLTVTTSGTFAKPNTVLESPSNPAGANIAAVSRPEVSPQLSQAVLRMETGLKKEFDDYFGRDLADVTQAPEDMAVTLAKISEATGSKTAVMWVIPREADLHLVLITPNQPPIVRDLEDVPKEVLFPVAATFQRDISSPLAQQPSLVAAQQLYEWIIGPYEEDFLKPQGIETLLFCLGAGVRTMPFAALHDGEQFLIEKYTLSRIPAFNLISMEPGNVRQPRVLAMGASEFPNQSPLPAVPVEINTILQQVQTGNQRVRTQGLLNRSFTMRNLQRQLRRQQPDIVHLATHAEFLPGKPSNSYIQLWDDRLGLDQVDQVEWRLPMLELLVLSACRTAVGDRDAELGFAGLALQSGVKSVLASLWYVDDLGTLALMSEFYGQLPQEATKGEALRQAQLNLLNRTVKVENNQLELSQTEVALPNTLTRMGDIDFSHPRYWAAFTMISSPW